MILSKNQLVQNIVNEISDNSTGQISPYDIRHNLLDVIDSVHLLSLDKTLNSLNFATLETRSTKAGENTLDKVNLDGYYSIDNSAFGYAALKSNYQGERNTALGSLSLSCNIYGEDNVGVGFTSLGGNTTGFGNVGVGNYALQNNKLGNFNIAIGHGAGYYVNRNTNKKLFIASHPVDEEYVCDNPLGSGLTPLVYGDLDNLKFGIAVNELHNDGVLQVSGNITPSQNKIFNLGSSNYKFNKAYLTSEIYLDSGVIFGFDYASSGLYVNSDLLPSITESKNLGTSSRKWLAAHLQNLYVSGQAFINDLQVITRSVYSDKTLFLASISGVSSASGYLSDENVDYGGIVIKASGSSPFYLRDYEFIFRPSGYNNISCLESSGVYSTSSWNSNISLNIADGSHLKTQRVVSSGRLSLVTDPNCYGIYLNDNKYYVSRGNVLSTPAHSSSGVLAGISDVNFLSNSGSAVDYGLTVASLESGVSVSQKFLTGSKVRNKDAGNSNKDKLRGFELKYFDDSSSVYEGPLSDRFVISSYDNTSYPLNNLIVMKNSNDGSVVGINNFGQGGEFLVPKTTLNVRSSTDSVIRAAAENAGNVRSALQLVGGNNCLQDGLELTYSHTSGIADLNIYKDSGKTIFMRFNENNTIGLLSSGITNATLTIGTSGSVSAISLRESLSNVGATPYYGKVFVRPVNKGYANQYHAIYLIDGSGYIHDLVNNNLDDLNGKSLYSDYYKNVFGGIGSTSSRKNILYNMSLKPSGNTGLGYYALHNLNSSGNYNTAIGSSAGSGITTGDMNTIIGANSADSISSGNQNVIVGSFIYNNTYNNSNNIIIGNSGLGNNASGDYKFLLGNGNIVLFDGTLGPNNSLKKLIMPSGGRVFLDSIDGSQSLGLRNNIIEIIDDGGNDYPENELTFRFTGNETSDLLILNHSGVPFTNSPTYANGGGPYAILNGDLRLKQYIRFSDNTSLNSASFLNDINNIRVSGENITNAFNNLVVEGYALNTIQPPTDGSSPTNGLLKLKNSSWTDTVTIVLVNRDKNLKINKDDYVIALKVNTEYRPLWVSSESSVCECCNK